MFKSGRKYLSVCVESDTFRTFSICINHTLRPRKKAANRFQISFLFLSFLLLLSSSLLFLSTSSLGTSLSARQPRAKNLWFVFWVVAVGLGRIFIYVGAGLDGFGRFWSVFWVVADNLGRIFIYVGAGLDGFERFSTLLDAIF